ncbi:MAG TPA: pyruvate dehydrogenase complex dihydrolipoamide acetyltransferase [Myxococcaceae bacterium]|nr:pyruvate dehydrogenase complex dihydrolipoamide acetyltransferase [Myxococcaceae bacterium]
MAKPIQMPSLSPTMTEGKISRWLKKEGDKVSVGEAIVEIETDKSNLEFEAPDDGVLLQITVKEGETVKVGAPIAMLGAKGEKVGAQAPAAAPQASKPAPAAPPQQASKPAAPAPAAPKPSGGGRAAKVVPMPSLSPTMTEGKIAEWLKKEGDKVSSGLPFVSIETDKSNLEYEAPDDGVLLKIVVPAGSTVKVGAPIAFIGQPGDRIDAGGGAPAPAPAAQAQAPAQASAPRAEAKPAAAPAPGGRVRASPLAKRIAKDRGLDLSQIQGSGPQGRIVKRDVETAAAAPQPTRAPAAAKAAAAGPTFGRKEPQVVPVTQMRKVIAQRMGEVKPGVPHFYLTVDVEMDAALKIREEAKAIESKVSVNDIIVKAAGVALRKVPKMNAQFHGDRILQFENADVGIAVAIEDGLITPVVKDADLKGLSQISAESRDLAERARKRALKPDEYTGGSITVSNLGMYGIDQFVAVINPPQAAILAVGQVAEKPVARDGQLVVRRMMSITLSGDHRVIDGALGAVYLKELKQLLEHPMRLLF